MSSQLSLSPFPLFFPELEPPVQSMGNTATSRYGMVLTATTNLLCRRAASAFQTAPPQLSVHQRSFRHWPSMHSTTRLKQDSGSNPNDAPTASQPTWTYTPYTPPPTARANHQRRFSSEWKVPEPIPIPEESLDISFVRSSGAGGQNVNKLNTKVELRFHVDSAHWLPSEVRDRLKDAEANRINNEGVFSLTCQEHRTQIQNRKEALGKLRGILRECWKRPKVRKMRKGLSKKTKENRMEMKRRIGEKKANRKRVDF